MDWSARSIGLRVGGHRGTSARAPENTVAAFELSVADGALYVETDIRQTADGALVVMHDADCRPHNRRPRANRRPESVRSAAPGRGAWYGPEFRASG